VQCKRSLKICSKKRNGNANFTKHYLLSRRYFKKILYNALKFDEFEEKEKFRNLIQNVVVNESFLDIASLELIEEWKDTMMFS